MPRLIRRPPRRAGFTLSEVLIVLMILGIVGTAILRVLVKQQQSYQDTSKQADMQREIRLTSSFLPSDLRSMSSAGEDVIQMEEHTVTFLANIGSAIICEKTGNTHVAVPPLSAANVTTTNWYTQPQVGDSIFIYDDSVDVGSIDDVWERRSIQSIATSTTACPGLPYTDPVADAGKPRWRFGIGGNVPDSSHLGAVVRIARPMRYRIYQETSGKWYVGLEEYVSGSWSQIEAVGGPFNRFVPGDASKTGLQFRYFDSLGVRLNSAAQRTRVSRIDVYLRTDAGLASVTERRPNTVQDSVMMRIAVRNFK
jgi:prepilin-type N-terminal cleavage/methylation domain-containing protein